MFWALDWQEKALHSVQVRQNPGEENKALAVVSCIKAQTKKYDVREFIIFYWKTYTLNVMQFKHIEW